MITEITDALETSNYKPLSKPAKQLDLPHFDTDRNAVETRLEALKRNRGPLLLRIVELVRDSRQIGMHRDAIAAALGRPVQSVTSPVLSLLRDGELVETAVKRETRWGSPAVIIVHRDFRTEGAK